ncbi:hypothetical protein RRG08_005313 [Elysia crispata]|uniref:Uncharacterized protein n=1 Tax=Elysia crispata TaxID=231223 RepID=A0AAE0YZQ0_9GAST|nr:hypothetical protein RRG08_005313 [Elysia crispata]
MMFLKLCQSVREPQNYNMRQGEKLSPLFPKRRHSPRIPKHTSGRAAYQMQQDGRSAYGVTLTLRSRHALTCVGSRDPDEEITCRRLRTHVCKLIGLSRVGHVPVTEEEMRSIWGPRSRAAAAQPSLVTKGLTRGRKLITVVVLLWSAM